MRYLTLFALIVNTLLVSAQSPTNDAHWELIWVDDFDFFNDNIWFIQDNFDHYGAERQVFVDENVYIENGSLICEIKNEIYSCPFWAIEPNWHCVRQFNTGQPYSYTSGWTETKQAYNVKYGFIEARIKFPYGSGLWPAFWTSIGNAVVNQTNSAEIDIAEMLGETGPQILTTNIHYNYCPPICPQPDYLKVIQPYNGYNWGNWHIYAMEWSPSKIIWYLDGKPIRTFPNHSIVDPVKLILGVGLRPGVNLSNMVFPYKMYTDFVRIYDLAKDCDTEMNVCNYDFWNHDNKLKKSITIGNGICINTLSAGQNLFLRASESVVLNGDFTVPIGAELYIDVNPCY